MMLPFIQIFFTVLITIWVALWSLGWLFRSGEETDRSLHEYHDSWAPGMWMRGKFGIWMMIVTFTAIGIFQGIPVLWQFLVSQL